MNARLAVLWAACALCGMVVQADDFTFSLEAVSPHPYTAAYLGNGFLGLETTPLGTTSGRCYVAGVYDHTAGDVPRIAAAPDWNQIDVYNGSHWLDSDSSFAGIEEYRQVLNMYDGVLRTEYLWTDGNKRIRVEAEEFVSRDRAGSAAIRVVLTPEFSGEIQVRLPLENRPAPRRYFLERLAKLDSEAARNPWTIWYPGRLEVRNAQWQGAPDEVVLSLVAHAPGHDLDLGEAVSTQWTGQAKVQKHGESEGVSGLLTLPVQSGVRYTFTKFAALTISTGATPVDEAARVAVRDCRRIGWEALLASNAAAWHKLWQTDIVLDGNPALQRTIHSMLFYLLGSVREGLNMSTPPMGLSSAGYYGHIFWDADTYLFPPLLILHPELARPMVEFRSRTREAALSNARRNGYQGAMYPWEADAEGAESTPLFAGQNGKYENHVNGDVALAAWQYGAATGDRQWLEQEGWPILRDTADFWVSRVKLNAKLNRYEIGNVVGTNESLIGISNDAYTNAVAKKNLELAIATAHELHQEPHAPWKAVFERLYVPDRDTLLLRFPLDWAFSKEKIRSALDEGVAQIQRGQTGAMMGGEFYPILAAELGDRTLIGKIIEPLWKPYVRPPFQAIAETPDNQNISFITGAGAFLQQFVFGYSGMRLTNNGFEKRFPPVLPPGVERMTLRNISVRGKRETLVLKSGELDRVKP